MWAVVEIGNKQYKIEEGESLEVERLKEAKKSFSVDKVLLFFDGKNLQIGRPYIKGIKVKAEVLGEKKDRKVIAFKFKRRKSYQRKKGHRQIKTRLKISSLTHK
ncbi:MAG: 50S ribosomal protein L21 [Candidatus Omnitrophica bacterium]|nr:50S ribosomal protein L21 [Candidatus Omnitrophota bacterium]